MAYYRCLEGNAAPGPAGETLKCYSGKIANTTGVISADSDYNYTDYFPMPNGTIIFNLGPSPSSSLGLTLYNEDKTYAGYYSFNSGYRSVDLTQRYASGWRYCRVCYAVANLKHVYINNVADGKIYSANEYIQIKEN